MTREWTISTRISDDVPRSIGIGFKPRDIPILAQAVAGTITQAMFNAYENYGIIPSDSRASFASEFTVRHGTSTFDTEISLIANRSAPYRMTNFRMTQVLSLLGYDFSTRTNLGDFKEYDFDVIVIEVGKPLVVIAKGHMANKGLSNASAVL